MNSMNGVTRLAGAWIVGLSFVVLAAGCGASHKTASTTTGTPAASTDRRTGGTPASEGGGEEQVPSISYDYAASADCLDQYSGAYGDNRGRDGAALVYTVRVPKDETEESDTGVRLLFYKTDEQAKHHVADPGFLPAAEKRVIGNVIVDGDAVRHQYAMQLVTACLKF